MEPSVRDQLRLLLLEDWHPIKFPVPSDEYDHEADGLLALLNQGASVDQAERYLSDSDPCGEPDAVRDRRVAMHAFAIVQAAGGKNAV